MHYKIKLADKAAFLNRVEKHNINVDSFDVVDDTVGGYFEFDVEDPELNSLLKRILRPSDIHKLKEYIVDVIREELARK
jgi:hypothetical protein